MASVLHGCVLSCMSGHVLVQKVVSWTTLTAFSHSLPPMLMIVCCCCLQGLGALIVRVDAADILHKLFWGGGAVSLATSSADFHVLKCRPADKLEDGTVNFLDIISLKVSWSPPPSLVSNT